MFWDRKGWKASGVGCPSDRREACIIMVKRSMETWEAGRVEPWLDSSASQFSNLIGHLHGSKSHSVIPPWAPLHSVIPPHYNVIPPHCSVIAPYCAKSNRLLFVYGVLLVQKSYTVQHYGEQSRIRTTTACFPSRVLSSRLIHVTVGPTVHVTPKTDRAVFKGSWWKAEWAALLLARSGWGRKRTCRTRL